MRVPGQLVRVLGIAWLSGLETHPEKFGCVRWLVWGPLHWRQPGLEFKSYPTGPRAGHLSWHGAPVPSPYSAHLFQNRIKKAEHWASLVVQWIGISLPIRGTLVRSLVQEGSTGHGETGHSATATEPVLQCPCSTAREAPAKSSLNTMQLESSFCFLHPEKPQAQLKVT